MTEARLRQLYPNASEQFIRLNATPRPADQAQGAIVERPARNGPLAKAKGQKRRAGKFLVRVTSRRRVLLDEDNLSEKYFVDCCRYAGLIPDDSAEKARIETTQERVSTEAEECTVIEISLHPRRAKNAVDSEG